ncbi:YdeI/OmpD-associated family protein [Microlunatus ginsengisoli]|uniref:DUF1905 domain-containing protein n=1 Tax=Microlunatus ginsengisoli TaxID=363863 RepID=A0ABP7AGV5_9ACTN
MTFRFQTTIELNGKTATGFRVPTEVVEALGSGKKPKVRVTIGPHTYRSTIAVYGGTSMLPLSAENRSAAGVAAGDLVAVVLELDTAPRTVELPDDLAAALAASPGAREAFDALSYSLQRERAESVASAKRAETRQRRIATIVDGLASS